MSLPRMKYTVFHSTYEAGIKGSFRRPLNIEGWPFRAAKVGKLALLNLNTAIVSCCLNIVPCARRSFKWIEGPLSQSSPIQSQTRQRDNHQTTNEGHRRKQRVLTHPVRGLKLWPPPLAWGGASMIPKLYETLAPSRGSRLLST